MSDYKQCKEDYSGVENNCYTEMTELRLEELDERWECSDHGETNQIEPCCECAPLLFKSDNKQNELVYLQANVVNKRDKYSDEDLAFKINKLLFDSIIAKFYV